MALDTAQQSAANCPRLGRIQGRVWKPGIQWRTQRPSQALFFCLAHHYGGGCGAGFGLAGFQVGRDWDDTLYLVDTGLALVAAIMGGDELELDEDARTGFFLLLASLRSSLSAATDQGKAAITQASCTAKCSHCDHTNTPKDGPMEPLTTGEIRPKSANDETEAGL